MNAIASGASNHFNCVMSSLVARYFNTKSEDILCRMITTLTDTGGL